ncbi:prenylcysteine methyltransferase [Heterostelium album PN500]|uniref:Protein-S-isoprenylcysteine O-methyltransferase n=1 Tax=Heterostelium pallidum (strain ATCC 26659 / Pp 5 / PN500) TaxID=670386 RepID=D3B267_HETP5|nr:prenylcysteine methyltransferase [Heterostelium album PN500]EFA84442.1 prenylcysteine methyltransferase [Heterostelium album PN500]|eukprot:XP_020436556.1 prenylcysteine methyltransferase [Heterostelium album PN500]
MSESNNYQSSDLSKQQEVKMAMTAWNEKGAARTVAYAFGLGILFGVGLVLSLSTVNHVSYGIYMMGLAAFHMWEYIWVSMYDPTKLSSNSFLLNHSTSFNLALLAGFIEYWIEYLLFPSMKLMGWISTLGFIAMVFGQVVRTTAMITAGRNFSHIVQQTKKSSHVLVTNGVYSLVRHPSYFGWFIWSISTQLVLFNPICTAAYAYASWKFFEDRIEDEEEALIDFFGNDYVEYKKKVWSGIPLIK